MNISKKYPNQLLSKKTGEKVEYDPYFSDEKEFGFITYSSLELLN